MNPNPPKKRPPAAGATITTRADVEEILDEYLREARRTGFSYTSSIAFYKRALQFMRPGETLEAMEKRCPNWNAGTGL